MSENKEARSKQPVPNVDSDPRLVIVELSMTKTESVPRKERIH